jgi:hypothetical protein
MWGMLFSPLWFSGALRSFSLGRGCSGIFNDFVFAKRFAGRGID